MKSAAGNGAEEDADLARRQEEIHSESKDLQCPMALPFPKGVCQSLFEYAPGLLLVLDRDLRIVTDPTPTKRLCFLALSAVKITGRGSSPSRN